MDDDGSAHVLDLDHFDQEGFLEGPDDAFEESEGHELGETYLAEQGAVGDEHGGGGKVALQEGVDVDLDDLPFGKDAVPETSHENGDLDDKDRDEIGEANGGPGESLEEDHEEAEADKDHSMDILEDGKFIEELTIQGLTAFVAFPFGSGGSSCGKLGKKSVEKYEDHLQQDQKEFFLVHYIKYM